MSKNISISLNYFPNINFEDFKDSDERFKEALKNLLALLNGMYIRYSYVTAKGCIGKYEKEIEIGIYLPDLRLTFIFPSIGSMRLKKESDSLNITDLYPDIIENMYNLHQFLNGQDLRKI